MDNLLEIKDLNVEFKNSSGGIKVISDLSLSVGKNETLGIVGESGSGKSVTSLSIMRLHNPQSTVVTGEINLDDKNLLNLSEKEMQQVRGNRIAMIFQEPMTSLNPIHTCGKQIMEPILLHTKATKKEAKEKALKLLELCGIPDPVHRFNEYPHQLSGGMRQRIMIAIALACSPELLIADEPTTALDVTIQAQILQLMKDIKKKTNMSIIMITHDLGIVSDFCDRVVIMYTGEIVESHVCLRTLTVWRQLREWCLTPIKCRKAATSTHAANLQQNAAKRSTRPFAPLTTEDASAAFCLTI